MTLQRFLPPLLHALRLPVLISLGLLPVSGYASATETERTERPASEPAKPEPLAFPNPWKQVPVLSIAEIEAKITVFNDSVGGYPPRFRTPADRETLYRDWSDVMLSARALEARDGVSERLSCALTALYRQGHNMDVAECGRLAMTTMQALLKAHPDSIPANWEASYLYLQISPKYAPEGEKALMHLRTLLHTDRNIEVERGLLFAYLYQQKLKEARKQADWCLKVAPQDKVAFELKEALKKGKIEIFEGN